MDPTRPEPDGRDRFPWAALAMGLGLGALAYLAVMWVVVKACDAIERNGVVP